jgi:hypothetical protein
MDRANAIRLLEALMAGGKYSEAVAWRFTSGGRRAGSLSAVTHPERMAERRVVAIRRRRTPQAPQPLSVAVQSPCVQRGGFLL